MKASNFHLLMMGVWGLLLVPSLTVWKESLFWVILMSWYANLAGYIASYQAARGEERTCKLEEKIDSK